MKWHVYAKLGIFRTATVRLGSYRWAWMAHAHAAAYELRHRHRYCVVSTDNLETDTIYTTDEALFA